MKKVLIVFLLVGCGAGTPEQHKPVPVRYSPDITGLQYVTYQDAIVRINSYVDSPVLMPGMTGVRTDGCIFVEPGEATPTGAARALLLALGLPPSEDPRSVLYPVDLPGQDITVEDVALLAELIRR